MVKVVKGLPAGWGMCSRTVMLDSITTALLYHKNSIAVGSEPGHIIILNAITGSQAAVLSGHTGKVSSVKFSPDGTSLVSGSKDKTVKLWDTQTGGVVKTFSGHTAWVFSVSISADCITIASGSVDRTICLWNTQTGESHCVIRQQNPVYYVSFSPTDPQHLISISGDKLWQWDTNGHQIRPPCDGSHMAFSSDGNQIVSHYDGVVTVQNSNSGVITAQFQLPGTYSHWCCFSPDGRLVAVTVQNCIYIWDITTLDPHLVETLIFHTWRVYSLTFSSPSSLISVSVDQSIKFWQIGASSANPVVTGPGSTPITLPLISSISLQTRDGVAISSGADGVVETWDIPASLCKASSQTPAKDNKLGDIKLTNSRLVFVWCADKKISIWDPEKDKFLLQADIPGARVLDIRISGDGSRVFCISVASIQAWDMWTGEAMDKVVCRYILGTELLAVEGSRVWVKTPGTKGWDFGIPDSPPVKLSTKPPNILHLNDTKLWDNSLCRIQDTVTGKVVFQLPARFQGHVIEAQWNGQYLVVSLRSEMELVLELHPSFLQ